MKRNIVSVFITLILAVSAFAQDTYKQLPKAIIDVLNAPLPPLTKSTSRCS